MNKDLQVEIQSLQREVLNAEQRILRSTKDDSPNVKKSIDTIHADLKYLSIIVNSAPIDPKDNMKIREFIRVHLENLWRIPLHA